MEYLIILHVDYGKSNILSSKTDLQSRFISPPFTEHSDKMIINMRIF